MKSRHSVENKTWWKNTCFEVADGVSLIHFRKRVATDGTYRDLNIGETTAWLWFRGQIYNPGVFFVRFSTGMTFLGGGGSKYFFMFNNNWGKWSNLTIWLIFFATTKGLVLWWHRCFAVRGKSQEETMPKDLLLGCRKSVTGLEDPFFGCVCVCPNQSKSCWKFMAQKFQGRTTTIGNTGVM